MPLFSVLMPTHNRADVIGYAIRAVLMQTERDFELLIVGDGCTDDTSEVIARFEDPRIRWFDYPKAPWSGYANRNLALREARGELIAYAQHDDLMLPDHLALMGRAMHAGIDWAYTQPLWVTTDGILVPYGTNLMNPDELTEFLTAYNTIPTNCIGHRRDCLERFGDWPEDIAEGADWYLWHKIIGGCGRERIAYVPVPTALHFSAIWKKSRHSSAREVHTWLGVVEAANWWPRPLRYSIPGPLQEQRILFEALQAGGDEFVADIRRAVGVVMDRVAWDNIRRALPRIAELETQLSNGQREMEAARAHVADLQAHRDAACAPLAQTEKRLEERELSLGEKAQALHQATQALHEASEAGAASRIKIAGLERRLAERETALQHTTQAFHETRAAQKRAEENLVATRRRVEECAAALRDAKQFLGKQTEAASILASRLNAMLASTSWRVTAPARRVCSFLRRRLGIFR
jgi:glycosyltransferase involved in cell wall biosynthesis